MIAEQRSVETAQQAVDQWVAGLNVAIEQRNYVLAAGLFADDCYWRDVLSLNWDINTVHGRLAIERRLTAHCTTSGLRNIRVDGRVEPGLLPGFGPTLEALISFDTNVAKGRGYLRLVADAGKDGHRKAVTLFTSLQELTGFPERSRSNRIREALRMPERGTRNWLDERIADRSYEDHDPQVLVIGAGHAGLTTAARLRLLDVDTLVIDRMERLGDNWRNRYHSLTLHNEICTNHLPYIPFPDSWPVFVPKDKLANWMEFYADSLELNVWTSTTFLDGTYDNDACRWTVRLQLPNGNIRLMRPSHVVLAIGITGTPHVPKFEGGDDFSGAILHSSHYTSEIDVEGKSVVVVGSGTSAHDIAQDVYLRGGDVTMLQRSSTTVVSVDQSARAYELYRKNEGVRPIEETDLMVASIPYDLLRRLHGPLSKAVAKADEALLQGLARVGFLLDNGEDDTGFFIKLVRYHGGYYIDVGASQLIIEGKIKLMPGVKIDRLTERSAVLSDRKTVDADLIVLGTGYQPLQSVVASLFSSELAERIGPVWGLGDDGELRNMWGRTAQPGLFIAGGTFSMCRFYSKVTALLIKAEIERLIPRTNIETKPSETVEGYRESNCG